MDILYSFCAFMMCSGVCINDNGILVSWKGTFCNMNIKLGSPIKYILCFGQTNNYYDIQEIKWTLSVQIDFSAVLILP